MLSNIHSTYLDENYPFSSTHLQDSSQRLNSPSSARSKYSEVWQRVRVKLRSKYYLSQLNSTLQRQDESVHIVALPTLIFSPDSRLKFYWNILISLTLLYTAIVTPFTIAFHESNTLDVWEILDLIIDLIYITDFLINCCSAYTDQSGNLVTNRKSILCNYLKSWFFIDLLSCLPFSLIAVLSQQNSNQANKFVRFIRLPRLYRLLKMSRLLKLLSNASQSDFLLKVQEFLSIKQSATRFATSITTILIAVHIVACLWYYTAALDDFSPDTWVVRSGYMDNDAITLYITCVYWAFTTLSTVGYGDLFSVTVNEKILAISWMLAGLYFLGFTVGSLSAMAASIDTKEKVLSKKLAAIDEFVADTKLNKVLAHKLRHALKYSSNITGFSWTDKHNLLNELPKNLKYDISMAMHRGAARHISFFVDKKNSLISSIVPFLNPMAVMKEEFVYNQGDFADEIYFLVKGAVEYRYNEHYIVSTINRSDYFGDVEVIFQIPRKYSAQAKRNLELLAMTRSVLNGLKKDYFCVWDEIRTEATERDKKNMLNQAKLVRKTMQCARRTVLMDKIENRIPSLTDLSEQMITLFEIAESFQKRIEKIQKVINRKPKIGNYYSDDEH